VGGDLFVSGVLRLSEGTMKRPGVGWTLLLLVFRERMELMAESGNGPKRGVQRMAVYAGLAESPEAVVGRGVAKQFGIVPETTRHWVKQAQIDGARRLGKPSAKDANILRKYRGVQREPRCRPEGRCQLVAKMGSTQ
jgi:hypothetical protein